MMDDATLAALGLVDHFVGHETTFDWPMDGALGLVQGERPATEDVVTVARAAEFVEIDLPMLEERGYTLEVARGLRGFVRVIADADASLEVRGVDGSKIHHDLGGASIVDLDLRQGDWVAISGDLGPLALQFAGGKCHVAVYVPTLSLPSADPIPAPPTDWLAIPDDPWLSAYVAWRCGVGSSWDVVAALGAAARLHRPQSAGRAPQTLLEIVTAGGRDGSVVVMVDRWARSLRERQRSLVEGLALTEIDLLRLAIGELELGLEPDEPSWRRRLLRVCHRRDDVESVAWVLGNLEEDTRLAVQLGMLDEAGEMFLQALPERIEFDDERLRRVALLDADGWWARPVAWTLQP